MVIWLRMLDCRHQTKSWWPNKRTIVVEQRGACNWHGNKTPTRTHLRSSVAECCEGICIWKRFLCMYNKPCECSLMHWLYTNYNNIIRIWNINKQCFLLSNVTKRMWWASVLASLWPCVYHRRGNRVTHHINTVINSSSSCPPEQWVKAVKKHVTSNSLGTQRWPPINSFLKGRVMRANHVDSDL